MSLQKILNQERPTEERNCPKHGAYTSTNFIGEHWTACPKCMMIQRDKEAKEQLAADERKSHKAWAPPSRALGQLAADEWKSHKAWAPPSWALGQLAADE